MTASEAIFQVIPQNDFITACNLCGSAVIDSDAHASWHDSIKQKPPTNATPEHVVDKIKQLYSEGLNQTQIASQTGVSASTVANYLPESKRVLIPVGPVRKMFEESRYDASTVAARAGITYYRNGAHKPDSTRLKRQLGIVEHNSHQRNYFSKRIDIDIAYRIVDAIGRERWELDELLENTNEEA